MAAKSAIWRPSLFGAETHLVLWCIFMCPYGQMRTNKDIQDTGTHTREIYDALEMVLVIFRLRFYTFYQIFKLTALEFMLTTRKIRK